MADRNRAIAQGIGEHLVAMVCRLFDRGMIEFQIAQAHALVPRTQQAQAKVCPSLAPCKQPTPR
jgi:hypothetical protein